MYVGVAIKSKNRNLQLVCMHIFLTHMYEKRKKFFAANFYAIFCC